MENNIFMREEGIVGEAENLLSSEAFGSAEDADRFEALLKEYKKMLKQMKRMVKMSDLMQSELNTLSHKLEVLSTTDALTGLFNRRHFNEMYEKDWYGTVRSQGSIAVIMMDIDYFKRYNDAYGHLQGDQCLQSVAKAIRESAKRSRDLAARYGGEEFVILLPETDTDGAARVARQVQAAVAELDIPHEESPVYKKVTLSAGIAAMKPAIGDKPDLLLSRADEALYRAKEEGRNCYRVY